MLRQIALVSQTSKVSQSRLAIVSAAIQKQVARDFGPIWEVQATVDAFPKLEDLPAGYYAVIVRDDVQATTGLKGVHHDPDKQPFALVQSTDDDSWSVDASHECLEMLADPSLNKLIASNSIKPGQGKVEYLLEVCDPCQSRAQAYKVNGVEVSDFYTKNYFDPVQSAAVRYSFTGAITAPKQVLQDGYLSWVVPETGEWWMGFVFAGALQFIKAGPPAGALSLREFIDSVSAKYLPKRKLGRRRVTLKRPRDASRARGKRLQQHIQQLFVAGRKKK